MVELEEQKYLEQNQYRAGLLLGAVAYPFFGWFSENFVGVDYDNLLTRLPSSTFALISLIGIACSKKIARYGRLLLMLAAFWNTYDYIGYFVQSNYHYYFTIGMTAMPFVVFTFFFYPIDIFIYFTFTIAVLGFSLEEFNMVFISTYLILMIMAFSIYFLVTRSRLILLKKLRNNIENLIVKQKQIEEKNSSLNRIGELATQVAHDIRSPVMALQIVSQNLSDMDPKKKTLIENSAKRINDVADYLLSEYRKNVTKDLSIKMPSQNLMLNDLISEIVDEKKVTLNSSHQIHFMETPDIKLPFSINSVEFKRILSNILNNSIEAFGNNPGRVEIGVLKLKENIQIKIQDNGQGIPPEILPKIFDRGVSGKQKGTGLGLAHAKEFFDSISGTIEVDTELGKGTSIILTMNK